MPVYLLHFARPINPCHPCQHYLGWCLDLETRIAAHRNGTGARLTQVARERGIDFVVARIWEDGDRTFERKLKCRKESPRLCPLCYPTALRAAIDVCQLALPIDLDPLPEIAPLKMDWIEIKTIQGWRARTVGQLATLDNWDDGLL